MPPPKYSSDQRFGEWSDWIWNEDYRRYYRMRQDNDGKVDYEWEPVTAQADNVPRTESYQGASSSAAVGSNETATVESVTQGLEQLATSPSGTAEYTTDRERGAARTSHRRHRDDRGQGTSRPAQQHAPAATGYSYSQYDSPAQTSAQVTSDETYSQGVAHGESETYDSQPAETESAPYSKRDKHERLPKREVRSKHDKQAQHDQQGSYGQQDPPAYPPSSTSYNEAEASIPSQQTASSYSQQQPYTSYGQPQTNTPLSQPTTLVYDSGGKTSYESPELDSAFEQQTNSNYGKTHYPTYGQSTPLYPQSTARSSNQGVAEDSQAASSTIAQQGHPQASVSAYSQSGDPSYDPTSTYGQGPLQEIQSPSDRHGRSSRSEKSERYERSHRDRPHKSGKHTKDRPSKHDRSSKSERSAYDKQSSSYGMKDKNAIPEEDPYQAQAQVFQEETAVAAAHVQYGESSYHGGAAAVSSQPTYAHLPAHSMETPGLTNSYQGYTYGQRAPGGIPDLNYRVMHSQYFSPGMILKTYWCEPKGSNSTNRSKNRMNSVYSERTSTNPSGEHVYTGYRRFIILRSDKGHSTCIPILTYEGRACAKKGVKPEQHGIIFDARLAEAPLLVPGEPHLGFDPVRASMTVDSETLSADSRINYSKPSTVEHNIEVCFIGQIHEEDWEHVQWAYDQCWNQKRRDRR